jgi:RNA polymerase sigma-70 factor, ECF subfamily
MDTEDRSLIARIAQKEQGALQCLYEKYQSRLYGYLWRQLNGDRSDVEDALQEIFLAIWRTAWKYRGEAQVITWIFQIAHFHTMHILYKQRLSDKIPLSDESDEENLQVEYLNSSQEETILDRLALNEALRLLTPKHREALELSFYHGFSQEEVAKILNMPIGTVKSRISYARRALSRAMSAVASEEEASS